MQGGRWRTRSAAHRRSRGSSILHQAVCRVIGVSLSSAALKPAEARGRSDTNAVSCNNVALC